MTATRARLIRFFLVIVFLLKILFVAVKQTRFVKPRLCIRSGLHCGEGFLSPEAVFGLLDSRVCQHRRGIAGEVKR